MIVLIYGGSGSGKSAYAEDYIGTLQKEGDWKYYIATMQAFGEEGRKRVERHRKLRAGKGFLTIEQPSDLELAVDKILRGETVDSSEGKNNNRIALLECMSNLAANEMFREDRICDRKTVVTRMSRGIEVLSRNLRDLVIVSNNVFEDGIVYDETTMEYMKALGEVNRELAALADVVVEVVAGIPLILK